MKADLTGMRFGRLTVLGLAGYEPRYKTTTWAVRCDCGNEFRCYRTNLVNGNTKSCGCLKADKSRKAWDRHKEKWIQVIENKAIKFRL